MKPNEILEAAKEADLSKYLRSYSEFEEIAERAGCDMSAMDGREYETMWCDRKQFEAMCSGIAAIIEKRTIERCAVVCMETTVAKELWNGCVIDDGVQTKHECAAAIRKLGEQ